MSAIDMDGGRIKPSVNLPRGGRWRVIPDSAMVKYAIVRITGNTNGYNTVNEASPTTASTAHEKLFMANFAILAVQGDKPILEVSPFGLMEAVDTSGTAIGDKVYLGATGTIRFTDPAGTGRVVGTVTKVSASAGAVFFDGSARGGIKSGQAEILNGAATVTVAVGAQYDGFPVVATLNEVDGVKDVVAAVISGGNLLITASAAMGNATSTTVGYAIFGG